MALIVLKNINKSFSGTLVLKNASLNINKGEKIGLVGRNGCGKTTLLAIAAGKSDLDGGERKVFGKLSCGVLTQEQDFGQGNSVLQAATLAQTEIMAIEQELKTIIQSMEKTGPGEELDRMIKRQALLEERYQHLGGYSSQARVESILIGVGFKKEDFTKDPNHLSGGEAKRLQLAMVLLGGHDILFLDEPGNHLDISGAEWLTDFLKDFKGAVLLVSHDRYLLNGVADRIVELEEGTTYQYKGDFNAFLEQRELRLENAEKEREAQIKEIQRGEEYIRRNFYGQKSKQAKSKQKMIDRIEVNELPRKQRNMACRFQEASINFDHILRFEDMGAEVGGRTLFSGLTLDLNVGETLGVIGPNGCGKSTFMKIIMGLIPCSFGSIWVSPLAEPAYFDQQLLGISPSGALLDAMHQISPKSTDGALRSHLARFLFIGDEVDKNIESLSGGERSRALLAKLSLFKTNLLILDEPTNHLDIYTRESLENTLKSFSGAAVIVSHDRHLLDGVADKLLVFGKKKLTCHLGGYSSYAAGLKKAKEEGSDRRPVKKAEKPAKRKPSPSNKKVKRKHTYEDLEALIFSKEERLEEIKQEMYQEEVYSDAQHFKKIEAEQKQLQEELKQLYEEWETWT